MEMEMENLKKQQIGPVPAIAVLAGIPLIVFLFAMMVMKSMKCNCIMSTDASGVKTVSNAKLFGMSLMFSGIAGVATYMYMAKMIPDASQ
jgi:hypothetical protein